MYGEQLRGVIQRGGDIIFIMENKRVQIIDNKGVVEVTETIVEKKVYRENNLLEQKAYFEGMLAKAQAGLDKVNTLLSDIENAKKV